MNQETEMKGKSTQSTVARQKALQRNIDALDKTRAKTPRNSKANSRKATAIPKQHLTKPGFEHELDLPPEFQAPEYIGSGKLQGMVAIITGGDSGIGRAVAVLFAREGADIAVLYLNERKDAMQTKKSVEAEGRTCITISGDVSSSTFCNSAVKRVVRKFGKLDVLVNNAAFQLHAERIEDLSDEHIQLTFQTNIIGYFYMARAAIPHMKPGSSIINTGSETGMFGSKHLLDYSSTKGAIHAFTMSLSANLLPKRIRVNCVAPGPVWTPLNPADKPAAEVANFGKDSDMGRPAQPEEISPAYVFLASPVLSSYINGVILPIRGGPGP
jgi:NAD(P)-dependent dehydrogenase (short-subunit alcohol dehydrogenase family)